MQGNWWSKELPKVEWEAELSAIKLLSYGTIFQSLLGRQTHSLILRYLSILGWRQTTPWTSHHFIAGLTYRDKQPPHSNSFMFLGFGRKLEFLEKTHADTGRKCKLHTETSLPGFKARNFLLFFKCQINPYNYEKLRMM